MQLIKKNSGKTWWD